jgi:hypothetical protein
VLQKSSIIYAKFPAFDADASSSKVKAATTKSRNCLKVRILPLLLLAAGREPALPEDKDFSQQARNGESLKFINQHLQSRLGISSLHLYVNIWPVRTTPNRLHIQTKAPPFQPENISETTFHYLNLDRYFFPYNISPRPEISFCRIPREQGMALPHEI